MKAKLLAKKEHVLVEEIEILEKKQNQTGGNDADNQIELPLSPSRLLNIYCGYIIYRNSDQQYENILWDKKHIKKATCQQQVLPPVVMGQEVKEQCDDWKEKNEFYGIK